MKLDTPRLDPIQPEDWSDEIKKILQPNVDKGTVFNIFKTLSHHPDLFSSLARVRQSRVVQIHLAATRERIDHPAHWLVV